MWLNSGRKKVIHIEKKQKIEISRESINTIIRLETQVNYDKIILFGPSEAKIDFWYSKWRWTFL
jgi:hypothetical protein